MRIPLAVCCLALLLVQPSTPTPQTAADEEAALRTVVDKFFAAYAKKDLDGFMALWSQKSPEYASRKQAMQQLFADNEKIEVKSLTVRKVTVDEDKATVRVVVKISAVDAKTGKPSAGFGKMIRNFAFVKEEGGWKIWHYAPAVEDLAAALVAAKTEEDRKALLTAEKELVTAELAQALNRQGSRFYNQGDYSQALATHRLAQSIAEQIGDKAGIAAALNNMGAAYHDQDNYALALECYQKSLTIYEALGDQAGIALTLGNIGAIHGRQGNYAQAMECHQKSLTICEALGDKAGIAHTLVNIGEVHRLQGRYAQALEFYQKSLTMKEALGIKANITNIENIAIVLSNIGEVHNSQGNYVQALEFAERATALARQVGRPELLCKVRANAGRAFRALNQPIPARQALEEAIAIIETLRTQVAGGEEEHEHFFEDKVDPYHAMVELLIDQNQTSEALAYAERAKARALLDMLQSGRVNVTKAMTETERERERALNNELVSLNTQIQRESQRSQPEQTHLANLKANLQKARLDYEVFRSSLYAAHPELRVRRGETAPLTVAQAVQWLQAQKARDQLVLEYVVTDDQTYLFALSGTGQLAVYPIKIARKELQQRVNDLREAMRQKEAGGLGSLPKTEAALRQLSRLLTPAAAMLTEARQVCIVPDDILWEVPFAALKMPKGQYLIEQCAAFYAPSLTALREMRKRSNGVMEYWSNGNKQHSNTPTLQHSNTPTLLAMAPFAYSDAANKQRTREVPLRGNFGTLPATEKEVAAVSQLYGTKPYLRETATETRVKTEAGKARILHFATHGLFDDLHGMYSGVVLAQPPPPTPPARGGESTNDSPLPLREGSGEGAEDGYLEAREVLDLDLNADLVVLSACETARGQLSRGEGVIGMSWAFFVAGCPSTVVSQWKVADESTAELMAVFYRNLKAGKIKAEALRQAQLSLLRPNPKSPIPNPQSVTRNPQSAIRNPQWSHPFYWSPFILVGDWQ